MPMTGVAVRGCGGYLPERIVSNAELAARLATSDEWITQRSGISTRHIAADGELTSDLATRAARRALSDAGTAPDDVDLIIVATATPDNTFPATAARVQAKLGVARGAAFDIQAVCAGFVVAFDIAANKIMAGLAKTALVIGAETFSRILDWEDRATAVLFGDGAGALVLQRADPDDDDGVTSCLVRTDGRLYDALYVDGGPSRGPAVGKLRMDGKTVFHYAVSKMTEIARETLAVCETSAAAIDWLVPHQANRRIIATLAEQLGIPPERVLVTVGEHANTSAASIPLALSVAAQAGRLRYRDLVLLVSAGAGMSWGAALTRWGKR